MERKKQIRRKRNRKKQRIDKKSNETNAKEINKNKKTKIYENHENHMDERKIGQMKRPTTNNKWTNKWTENCNLDDKTLELNAEVGDDGSSSDSITIFFFKRPWKCHRSHSKIK